MVRSSVVIVNFFIEILLGIVLVSATPNFKGTLQRLLSEGTEDKTLAYIVAVPHESSVINSELENADDYDRKEEIDDKAADLLQQLLKPRKKQISPFKLNLRSIALRTDCNEKMECIKNCMEKKKCQKVCKVVHDAYNLCGSSSTRYVVDPCKKSTTRDPCQKWGKTLPPHWRKLLRASDGGKWDYEC